MSNEDININDDTHEEALEQKERDEDRNAHIAESQLLNYMSER